MGDVMATDVGEQPVATRVGRSLATENGFLTDRTADRTGQPA